MIARTMQRVFQEQRIFHAQSSSILFASAATNRRGLCAGLFRRWRKQHDAPPNALGHNYLSGLIQFLGQRWNICDAHRDRERVERERFRGVCDLLRWHDKFGHGSIE